MKTTNKSTIWTPEFISIFCINIFIQMGMYMMNSLVSKFATHLGATPAIIGMIASMAGVTSLAMAPINGPAYDAFSKRKLLSLATGVTACVFALYSLADSVTMVMIARVLHGISSGCIIPLCLLLASDTLPEDKMSSGIGTFSLAQCTASALAPGIGLALAENLGFNKTFLIGAGMTFCSFLLTFLIKENKNAERKPFRISLGNMISKRALIPGGVMFFVCMGLTCINSFIIVYADALGVSGIAIYFTIYSVGLMIFQPIFGRLADRFGITKIVIFGTVTYAIALLVISSARSLPVFMIAAALASLGYGALHPTMQSLTIQCAEEGKRGAASNTYYFCLNICMTIAPSVAGGIADYFIGKGATLAVGYANMYRLVCIPIMMALVYYMIRRKELPKTVKK